MRERGDEAGTRAKVQSAGRVESLPGTHYQPNRTWGERLLPLLTPKPSGKGAPRREREGKAERTKERGRERDQKWSGGPSSCGSYVTPMPGRKKERESWAIRMEHATTQGILRLRANKASAKQREAAQATDPPTPPTLPATDPNDHHSTASSSHEMPRSYYPPPAQQQKPTTTTNRSSSTNPTTPASKTTEPRHHDPPPAFVDTRQLRQNQPNRLPQPQPDPARQTPSPALAERLQDGRNTGKTPTPSPSNGPSPPPAAAADPTDPDTTNFMQHTPPPFQTTPQHNSRVQVHLPPPPPPSQTIHGDTPTPLQNNHHDTITTPQQPVATGGAPVRYNQHTTATRCNGGADKPRTNCARNNQPKPRGRTCTAGWTT